MSTTETRRPAAGLDEAPGTAQRRALLAGVVATIVVGVALGLVLVAAVGLLVGLLVLVVVWLLGSLGWTSWVTARFAAAEAAVAGGLGRRARPGELPALDNALEGVAVLTGVQVPAVRVIDDGSANAMVACGEDTSTVVVTTGLLEDCGSVQAEAIAASLLCRVRDRSARCATLAAGLPPLLVRVAGLEPAALAALLGPQRAVLGDADVVGVTRYPPGLIAALARMAERGTRPGDVPAATAPMWVAPAVGPADGVDEAIDATVNQPLEYRIAVLAEL